MKTYKLKLTSAMVIAGGVVRAGASVDVDEVTAKDFLRRGKAELVSKPAASHQEEHQGDQDNEVDLSRMNKAQLVEVAAGLGIEGADDLTKAEIIAAIEAAGE